MPTIQTGLGGKRAADKRTMVALAPSNMDTIIPGTRDDIIFSLDTFEEEIAMLRA